MCRSHVWGTYSTVIYQSAVYAQADFVDVYAAALTNEATAVFCCSCALNK